MFWGFAMEKRLESAQNGSEKPQKRRSEEEKVGRRKWIIRALKRQEIVLRRIDRRPRMLAAGLRGLFALGEDYVSMVASSVFLPHSSIICSATRCGSCRM